MRIVIFFVTLFIFNSCVTLPEMYEFVENMAINEGMAIKLSENTMKKQKDLDISVKLNKIKDDD